MDKPAGREECLDCLCLASRKAARELTRFYDRKMRSLGLRMTQFSLMVMIGAIGKTTIGKLAEFSGTERTTLTRNLALLETSELVRLNAGDDAREREVSLTKKGAAMIERGRPLWREAQAEAKRALGPDVSASLMKLSQIQIQI